MSVILGSEIAKLVFGYLQEEQFDEAATAFCRTSPHLVDEYDWLQRGYKTCTTNDICLVDIIREYCKIKYALSQYINSLSSPLAEGLRNQKSLSEKVNGILNGLTIQNQSTSQRPLRKSDNATEATHPKELPGYEPAKKERRLSTFILLRDCTPIGNVRHTSRCSTDRLERSEESGSKPIESGFNNGSLQDQVKHATDNIIMSTEKDPTFKQVLDEVVQHTAPENDNTRASSTPTPNEDNENADYAVPLKERLCGNSESSSQTRKQSEKDSNEWKQMREMNKLEWDNYLRQTNAMLSEGTHSNEKMKKRGSKNTEKSNEANISVESVNSTSTDMEAKLVEEALRSAKKSVASSNVEKSEMDNAQNSNEYSVSQSKTDSASLPIAKESDVKHQSNPVKRDSGRKKLIQTKIPLSAKKKFSKRRTTTKPPKRSATKQTPCKEGSPFKFPLIPGALNIKTPSVRLTRLDCNTSMPKLTEYPSPTLSITPGGTMTPHSQSRSQKDGNCYKQPSGSSYYKPDESDDEDKSLDLLIKNQKCIEIALQKLQHNNTKCPVIQREKCYQTSIETVT